MNHIDLLETEYKEQYNQYRWIGQMQAVVLTFYGAVVVFSFLPFNALRPQLPQELVPPLLAAFLIVLGFLGIFTGMSLRLSREMQDRTACYIACLLVQMASGMDASWVIEQSALRYRALTSNQDRARFLDTMNIAFYIAFFSGEVFLICGCAMLFVEQKHFTRENIIIFSVVLFFVLMIVTYGFDKWRTKVATRDMKCDYCEAGLAHGLDEMLKKFCSP